MSRSSIRPQLAAAAVAVGLALTACGGDSDGAAANGIASATEISVAATSDDTDESTTTDPDAPDNAEDAFALFDQCMTDAGFDFATDSGGAEGGITLGDSVSGGSAEVDPQGGPASIGEFDFDAFEAANVECEVHLQGVDVGFDLSPEQEAALSDAQLEFTDCMRDLGVDVAEFEDGAGDGLAIVEGGEAETDPQTGLPSFADDDFDFEKFEEASQECSAVFDKYAVLDGLFGGETS